MDKFGPEISDVIVDYDVATLERKQINRADAVSIFAARGNRRAAEIIGRIPERDGVLDPDAVDAVLLRSHYELQRVSELMEHGRRVHDLLQPLVKTVQDAMTSSSERVRVVDIGCGPGFVIRWLAACTSLPTAVDLIGVDYNATFVRDAQRLAEEENLNCRFEIANGFKLSAPAHIYLSTGVVHHFRGAALEEFFRQHAHGDPCAFAHFDFQPTPAAPFGSWLFHEILMREPLARHDGVLSAVRAHPAEFLLASAVTALPTYRCAIYGAQFWALPVPRVLHCVIGMRPEFCHAFSKNLGMKAAMLGAFT